MDIVSVDEIGGSASGATEDQRSAGNDGPTHTDLGEPLRDHVRYVEAALSYYDAGPAANDVRGAWRFILAALPRIKPFGYCAPAEAVLLDLLEGLQEGLMEDVGLKLEDRAAMRWQIEALSEALEQIRALSSGEKPVSPAEGRAGNAGLDTK